MAKIFFTSRYYKNPARSNVGKLLRYVATREGAERLPNGIDRSPSTVRKQRLISEILKSFPQSCEYEDQSNKAAIRLYEKNGFQTIGLRKSYYTKPVEDAILMERFTRKMAE